MTTGDPGEAIASVQHRGNHATATKDHVGRAVLVDQRTALVPYGPVVDALRDGFELEVIVAPAAGRDPVVRTAVDTAEAYVLGDGTGVAFLRLSPPVAGFAVWSLDDQGFTLLREEVAGHGAEGFWRAVQQLGLASGGEEVVDDTWLVAVSEALARTHGPRLREVDESPGLRFWPPRICPILNCSGAPLAGGGPGARRLDDVPGA